MTGRVVVTHQECDQSMTAEKYILGELSSAERDRFEDHYFECPECADAVRGLSLLREGTRTGLCRRPESPAVTAGQGVTWFRLFRDSWPQAAVALATLALAAVTGYQYAQFRNQLHPQVLRSVTLQLATRGAIPRVPVAEAPFVLLEADLPGASGDLTWTVRASNGGAAANGRTAAPEPGLSLKILLPGTSLPAGESTLTIRSDTGKEWVFRFRAGNN